MSIYNFLLSGETADAAAEGGSLLSTLMSFAPILLILAAMYFMLIRPEKKRTKAAQEMRAAIDVGDEIITAGGIVGRVVKLEDDTLVIESTSDKTKMRVTRWSVQMNTTKTATPQK